MADTIDQPQESRAAEPEAQRIELAIPAELYRRALALAAQESWPPEEALLTVLSHGLAYLEEEREVSRLNQGEPDLRAAAERWLHRAMELDAAYAVMKFRAYLLGQQVKTLEMNVVGLRGENELARKRLALFREDEQRLRAELATLRQPPSSSAPCKATRPWPARERRRVATSALRSARTVLSTLWPRRGGHASGRSG